MKIARLGPSRRFDAAKMVKVSLFETPRMFCDLYCLEPGQSQKAHAHEGSDKVYAVIQGRARFEVGEEIAELGEGEAVLAPSGLRHGVANVSTAPLVVLVFMAPPPAPPPAS
jgi:mannose-6-phosphate isomerase-like protein (cupin superfamily)